MNLAQYPVPMGRRRTKDFDLPPHMQRKGGALYYVTNGTPREWIPLGSDLCGYHGTTGTKAGTGVLHLGTKAVTEGKEHAMSETVASLELKDLVGEYMLDAVDTRTEKIKDWCDELQDSECLLFRLDGKVYMAIEDPSDGYRSCMRRIEVSDAPMKNVFAPQRVVASHRNKGADEWSDGADILALIDVVTGRMVLEVGTENMDDYYPCWVAAFHPEAMAINAKK